MNPTSSKPKRARSNEDSKRSPAKRQYRNENEKRRRDLFSQLIGNLEDILTIENKSSSDNNSTTKISSQTNKLDKASVLRETATFLRKHQDNLIFQSSGGSSTSNRTNVDRTNEIVDFTWKPSSTLVTMEEWIETAIESMNCFFLVAKSDPHNGQIVYVSKNISSLLDYSQNELLNRSLFELILPRDHDQLRDYLLKDHRVLEKCNLSWRRATADEYEECTIIGAFRQLINDGKYLMSIVKVNTLDRTLFLNNDNINNQVITRINHQGQFIHMDSKTGDFLGYNSYELIGRTHFDFVHPDDLPIIVRAHRIWKENGNGLSEPYRFLSKGQQWIFLQTNCQVQINAWTGKADSYLCTSNLLQNPTDSLQRQLTSISSTFPTLSSTISQSDSITSSTLRTTISTRRSSSDTQITSFLSHLGNENYRKNIREKLNERRLYKQAEIHVREEEIKVIQDIIQFIDQFQSKHQAKLTTTTARTTIDQDSLNEVSDFESDYDPTLLQSSLLNAIEQFSPQYSPLLSRQELPRDETMINPIGCHLFSPSQQETFSIPSPITPFSIPSRPSPIALSVSPLPSSPLTQSISPSNNPSTTQDFNTMKPPSISSSSSSSPSSSSSNPNVLSTEQSTSKKSSFNRSLPHSLVS